MCVCAYTEHTILLDGLSRDQVFFSALFPFFSVQYRKNLMFTPEQAYLRRIGFGGNNDNAQQGTTMKQVTLSGRGEDGDHQVGSGIHVKEGEKLLSLAGYIGGPTRETCIGTAPCPPNEIDVVELRRAMKQKEERHLETFRIVLERCYRLIRKIASVKKYACVFEVPEFIPGHPLYDIIKCIEFIVRSLTSNGYAVQYVFPRTIMISWQVVQNKQQESLMRNILNMQQKSIDSALKCQEKEMESLKLKEAADEALVPSPDALHAQLHSPVSPMAPPMSTRVSSGDPSTPQQQQALSASPKFKSIAEFKPSGKFVLHV